VDQQDPEPDPKDGHLERVGAQLRAARQARGLSLAQVAALSGGSFTKEAVGSWERGERTASVTRLAELATLYRVRVADLLSPGPIARRGATTGPRGRTMLDLQRLNMLSRHEAQVVRAFATAIQRARGAEYSSLVAIRAEDAQHLINLCGPGVCAAFASDDDLDHDPAATERVSGQD
jgi:transcriptional regulator with XRE-family HTH domain